VGAFTRELSARGHQVTVCATDVRSATERLPLETKARGIDLRLFPNRSNRLAYHLQCYTPAGLHRYLRDHAHRFDVAHLHACRNLPGAIAAHYLTRYGVPYVIQPNGTAPLIERRQTLKRIFDSLAGRRMMRNAAAIVAVSEAERDQLLTLGVPDRKIRVVPNPVDVHELEQRDSAEPAIDGRRFRERHGLSDVPLVVFLGKITPRKRVDVLTRAFAAIEARAHLVIAGNDMGGLTATMALAADLGVSNRVHCTGLVSGRDRFDVLAAADVVVYPGEDEIFGLVPMEALLCGTPVVVAGDSGCGEVIRRVGGGLVVSGGDERALAAGITGILSAPETWRAAARTAAANVRAEFGASGVTASIEGVYREVVDAPPLVAQAPDDGISFIVPVKNGMATLARTIASIEEQGVQGDRTQSEILAIDDRSSDGSLEWLNARAAEGKLRVLSGHGRGLSAAINLGVRASQYPVICQVDQDVELLPGFVDRLTGELRRNPRLGAVQGHYTRSADARLLARVMSLDLEQRYVSIGSGRTDHVCTGNTAFRKQALVDAGLFDESIGYGGDNDMSYRLTAAGWTLAHCAQARSHHRWRDGLAGYWRQQYGFGYGRLDVVQRHPRRVTGDRVSPTLMMAHPIATALALACAVAAGLLAIAGVNGQALWWIAATAAGAVVAERTVAGVRACWRFGDPAALLFPIVHVIRNFAWVAAMGVWSFRRATGQAASAADSMAPRAAGVRTFIPAPIRTVGIIPAHNEMGSLARVVTEIRENCPELDLLVVDDGSTDASASVLTRLGVRYLQMPERLGVGSAMRAGLRYAARLGYDSAIRLDGDGQHGGADIERLLDPLRAGVADVSLGSRFLHEGAGDVARPRVTRLAQSALGLCLSALTRRPVTDPTSGFYALGPRAMRLLSEHHPTGYAEPELRLLLCRNELAVMEVPVAPRPRLAGRTSLTAGRLAAAGARVLLAMLIVPLRPGIGPPPGE
jgi:glycosyltransferase involved in cell wall biosynthesis